MSSYDAWKLASPYEFEGPEVERVAEWYGIDPAEVTERMLENFEHDMREHYATRGL